MVAGGDGADCDEEKNRRDAGTERDEDGGGVGRGVQRMHVTTVPRLPVTAAGTEACLRTNGRRDLSPLESQTHLMDIPPPRGILGLTCGRTLNISKLLSASPALRIVNNHM